MLSAVFAALLACPLVMLRIKGCGSFPRALTQKEEADCLQRYAQGDMEARNELIEHNLRLVAHIIKKYYTQTSDQDDLISIGTIGLIKGISTYRADKGVRLATYASRCIENEVLMFFRSQKKTAGDISLSESIDSDGEGNSLSLMDVLSVEDDMLENISGEETVGHLLQYVDQLLDAREQLIIRQRYGLGGEIPRTQREIALRCGISRSYVSRIEKRALEKLKAAFGED